MRVKKRNIKQLTHKRERNNREIEIRRVRHAFLKEGSCLIVEDNALRLL